MLILSDRYMNEVYSKKDFYRSNYQRFRLYVLEVQVFITDAKWRSLKNQTL